MAKTAESVFNACKDGGSYTVALIDGVLVTCLPVHKGIPSSTGKTLMVASTNGNQPTAVEVEGKVLYVGANAYVKA